ncbi:site-specific recombinase [Peijinzhouia sedimentorum]
MKELLDKIHIQAETGKPELLIELVQEIRPSSVNKHENADKRLNALISILEENEYLRRSLRRYLREVFMTNDPVSLLTETGILSNKGFFAEGFQKFAQYFLPAAKEENVLQGILNESFHRKTDYRWIEKIPSKTWEHLFELLSLDKEAKYSFLQKELFHYNNALEIISHRIAGISLDPDLIDRFPLLEKPESPFLLQNRKIVLLLNKITLGGVDSFSSGDYKEILEVLEKCEEVITTLRHEQHEKGAELSLTYLIQRLHQHTDRLNVLLEILYHQREKDKVFPLVFLFKKLVKAENRKNNLIDHFYANVGLLAFQITEHAGKTGDKYITHDWKGYSKMLFSSMGGGLIVGILSCIKVLIYYLRLAPFGEAFLYSMNYSLGFIGIHLTKTTLATKQPAMTATKIAASLDVKGTEREALSSLSNLIVKVFRSQFIAFVGNVVIAFPVAFLVAYGYASYFGEQIAKDDKAMQLITEIHPWESLSLFYAGIAGVCLFLSGVISGYYDNKVVFARIPQRLREHKKLKAIMSEKTLEKFSNYIDNNLGSLTGNFFLGIFLGSMGTLGFIFGLPLDIRHITFASGNFGIAMFVLGDQISLNTVLVSLLGIAGIGLMNFLVSFGLAIYVAILSRGVAFSRVGLLFSLIGRHLWRHPMLFFFPPAKDKKDGGNETAITEKGTFTES